MSVDKDKWLEIASKFQPTPQRPTPKTERPHDGSNPVPANGSQKFKSTRSRKVFPGQDDDSFMESRIAKMEELLTEKTKIIERQRAIIARLNQNLAAATTQSLAVAYDIEGEHRYQSEENIEEEQEQDLKHKLGDDGGERGFITPSSSSSPPSASLDQNKVGQRDSRKKKTKKSPQTKCERRQEQQRRLPLKSQGEGGNNDTKCVIDKKGGSPAFVVEIAERLDSLTQRMDKLEAKLPEKIRSICAQVISSRELCHEHHEEICCTACCARFPPSSKFTHFPVPGMCFEEEQCIPKTDVHHLRMKSPAELLTTTSRAKSGHKFCREKAEQYFKKGPSIEPKSNVSSHYRLQHSLQRLKERDKENKHGAAQLELSGSFTLSTIEDKLASIENVVSRFKEYLFKVLYTKLQL